ncbi:hypothetical protein [Altibacter lentus]|uniref:hypothetical protein n=1 Tax=Altibacter lentus TaxID=1223410 RepID=UPI001267AE2E|nr:hypothetical protein [Altibacter lentus]
MAPKYAHYLSLTLYGVIAVYVLVGIFYFSQLPIGSGDEALFLKDLRLIEQEGWNAAVRKGISIPYMLLVLPFAQLFEGYVALRLVNVALFLLLLLYFYSYRKIRDLHFYALVLFFYATVGYFLLGVNDTLFIVSMVVFYSETYFRLASGQRASFALGGTALIVAFFTRELLIIFTPVVLLSVFLLVRRNLIAWRSFMLPAVLILVFIVLNLPSLQAGSQLSFDAKLPPEGVQSNWVQRQYLAQLQVNEGTLPDHNHPSWEETDAYLETKGPDALPKGILSGLTFDPLLTIKEFGKDLLYILSFSTRQIGLLIPILLLLGIRQWRRTRSVTSQVYVSLLLACMILIFALIIISFVELRWFGALFLLAILAYTSAVKAGELPRMIVSLQSFVIILISLYGLYGFYQKLS